MNIFGIGIWELLSILIVILLVIGPERLPKVARQLGKYYRSFRRVTTNLTGEFKKAIDWEEDEELKNTVEDIKADVQDVGKVLSSEVEETKASAKEATQSVTEPVAGTAKDMGETLASKGESIKKASSSKLDDINKAVTAEIKDIESSIKEALEDKKEEPKDEASPTDTSNPSKDKKAAKEDKPSVTATKSSES
jgi:Tat protein translocase TatB subunit